MTPPGAGRTQQQGSVDPKWGYAGVAALFFLAISASLLAPFAAPPSPDRVAGVLFGFGWNSASSLSAVLAADPSVRLVDQRWSGQLVFVAYQDPAFPAKVARLGAWHVFDAAAAGCHRDGALQAIPVSKRPNPSDPAIDLPSPR